MIRMSDLVYLYAAYTVISVGILAYVAYLHTRQVAMQKEMDLLLGKVSRHGAGKK